MAIGRVGPMGIAPQIGPVGLRGPNVQGALPCERLAPHGEDRAHPFGHRIVRIGVEKPLIAGDRVALERGLIGLLRAEVRERPVLERGKPGVGRRRRGVLRAIEEHELRLDPVGVPRDDRPLAQVADPQPHLIEHVLQRNAALPHHLGESLSIGAVRVPFRGSDRPRRRVEGDQRSRVRIDEGEPARERLALLGEGVFPRGVDDRDARLQGQGGKGLHQVRDAHGLDRRVGAPLDPGVDRNDVVLAFELEAVAREIDESDGAGPRLLSLADEVTERAAQRVAIEVAGAGDVEAGSLQLLSDQAGVVGRGRQCAIGIGRVSDHERDALLGLLGLSRPGEGEEHKQARQQAEAGRRMKRKHGVSPRECDMPKP